jgi:osmoprotectant transport system substrate-binding protein
MVVRGSGRLVLALILLVGCSSGDPQGSTPADDDAITVASFNFPESVLLAELYAQALDMSGFHVERQLNLGTRELVEPALERGLVELVPEYAGSALEFIAGTGSASSDARATHRSLTQALANRGVTALEAAPAQDRNGIVVTRATADRYGLRAVSDLAPIAADLTFGGPPECPSRDLCLRGLRSTYGLAFKGFVPLDEGGRLTVAALVAGQVQVALMFTSDGALDANGLVLLKDDRHLQPAENVTPVIRSDVLARLGPRVADVVNAVSAALTTDDLRRMNADLARGATARSVAHAWLVEHGPLGSLG